MIKRGPKPKEKVKVRWSRAFAYGIGLLASDGNLSPDKRHINFTSKDKELIDLFQKAFNLDLHVGVKSRGRGLEKCYYVAQFSDVVFYDFLISIGLAPNKSKSIAALEIPRRYFFDFLRGSFDGDGSTYSYFDPRWKSSFMYYTVFASASRPHLEWLQENIRLHIGIVGHVTGAGRFNTAYQLKYAKFESGVLLAKMYAYKNALYLTRKKLKIDAMLRIMPERQEKP
jgi:hypothetical protein